MYENEDLGIVLNLIVSNSLEAIEFYKKAFSAEEISKYMTPDGIVMHAAIKIIGEYVYLNDSFENSGILSPSELGRCPLNIWLRVDDPDKLYKQAIDAGCKVTMEIDDMFWGDRMGGVVDPYGYMWTIAKTIEDVDEEELERRSKEFFKEMENM